MYSEKPLASSAKLVNDKVFLSHCTEVMGNKWRPEILWLLLEHEIRFNELKRTLYPITQRALSLQLKDLEKLGLITRTVDEKSAQKVRYQITQVGRSLQPVLKAMVTWGKGSTVEIPSVEKVKVPRKPKATTLTISTQGAPKTNAAEVPNAEPFHDPLSSPIKADNTTNPFAEFLERPLTTATETENILTPLPESSDNHPINEAPIATSEENVIPQQLVIPKKEIKKTPPSTPPPPDNILTLF